MPDKFRFDPFGWLTSILPESFLHLFIQFSAIIACGYFVYIRIKSYRQYPSRLLWVAETALFLLFGVAYLVRVKPINRSSGFTEILVPLVSAFLPMALVHWPGGLGSFISTLFSKIVKFDFSSEAILHLEKAGREILEITPVNNIVANHVIFYTVISIMIFGNLFACVGIISLRRSFSITPEARKLVSTGLYRFIRHPVYLGEIVAALGIAVARFNLRNCIIYIVFVSLQVWRAFMEERKLASAFPEYADYKKCTGFIFPYFL